LDLFSKVKVAADCITRDPLLGHPCQLNKWQRHQHLKTPTNAISTIPHKTTEF